VSRVLSYGVGSRTHERDGDAHSTTDRMVTAELAGRTSAVEQPAAPPRGPGLGRPLGDGRTSDCSWHTLEEPLIEEGAYILQ